MISHCFYLLLPLVIDFTPIYELRAELSLSVLSFKQTEEVRCFGGVDVSLFSQGLLSLHCL